MCIYHICAIISLLFFNYYRKFWLMFYLTNHASCKARRLWLIFFYKIKKQSHHKLNRNNIKEILKFFLLSKKANIYDGFRKFVSFYFDTFFISQNLYRSKSKFSKFSLHFYGVKMLKNLPFCFVKCCKTNHNSSKNWTQFKISDCF